MPDVQKILDFFYPLDTPLKRLLLRHSMQVRQKALALCPATLDRDFVGEAAMLHDIGILRCHAPGILCTGSEPYLAHGLIGGAMLREYGAAHQLDLERFARVCERHTGAGLTKEEIRNQSLPIPMLDLIPESGEEELVCYADKFFSKSGDMQEKSLEHVRRSLARFGAATLARFEAMHQKFGL